MFILAGFCEIGGGYWFWLKEGKLVWYGVFWELF
ncbi:hypothetical protein [Chryseobacterium sp.]